MFYAGTNNEVYQRYARYRDWLYTIDEEVQKILGISLFFVVNMDTLRKWYTECIGTYEAIMRVMLEEAL